MKSLWILALLFSSMMAMELGRPQPTFDFFDTNADGGITKPEFAENSIKWKELMAAEEKKMEKMMNKMDVTMTFYDLDINGDEIITREEFKTLQNDPGWGCYETF